MDFNVANIYPILPEIVVLAFSCLALMSIVFINDARARVTYYIVQLGVVAAFVASWPYLHISTTVLFDGSFIMDKLAVLLKLFIYIATFMAFWYSRVYVKSRDIASGEYYVLGLLSMLGMMVLVSAGNFITIFLGLELLSLPLYAMVALWRDRAICTEAAMKYFIIGAMATGMLLYGLSLIYGATKSLEISTVAQAIASTPPQQNLIFLAGLVFVIAGVAFKIGVVPFHMWVPDVYEGAPSSVTLFLSAAPKIAAVGLAIRILTQAMPSLHIQWQHMLIALSVLSMALGNLAAIVQSNIKRMLAYSAIAHMGYTLLGFIAGTATGYAASTFYILTYSIMSLGAFGMIVFLSHSGFECEQIDDFHGLNTRNPWLALMMLLIMFSMAGIPPLVGFIAKVGVLEAVIRAHQVWLAVVAILFAIIGSYYYIRVVKVMYFEEPVDTSPIICGRDMQWLMSVNGLAVLLLGIFPGFLFTLCQAAF